MSEDIIYQAFGAGQAAKGSGFSSDSYNVGSASLAFGHKVGRVEHS